MPPLASSARSVARHTSAPGLFRDEPRQKAGGKTLGRPVQRDDAAVEPDGQVRVRHEHARTRRLFPLQPQRHLQRRRGRAMRRILLLPFGRMPRRQENRRETCRRQEKQKLCFSSSARLPSDCFLFHRLSFPCT